MRYLIAAALVLACSVDARAQQPTILWPQPMYPTFGQPPVYVQPMDQPPPVYVQPGMQPQLTWPAPMQPHYGTRTPLPR